MYEAEVRGREYIASKGMSDRIIDFKNTDITAESTAEALGVDVDRICKGLAFKGKNGTAIVIIAGSFRFYGTVPGGFIRRLLKTNYFFLKAALMG